MAIMPGASRVQKFSGNRHKAKIDKIVLHTTEGGSWPGYNGGGNAPHFTVHRGGRIRQHIDTAYSAKALVNRRGGVETNNDGCIQIEFIGSCDRAYAKRHKLFFVEDATDEDFEGLAKVLAWIHQEHGVVLSTRDLVWSDTNAAYATAPQRMSFKEWRDFTGVCGHAHVPENDHWDPGKMDVDRVLVLARRLLSGGGVPAGGASAPAARPSSGKLAVDGRWGQATTRALQKRLKVTQDGRAGSDTWKALQRLVKAPYVDGQISRQSYKATELGNGIVPKWWGYTGRGSKGSQTVVLLQKRLGVTADGVVGAGTVKALQKALNNGTL